MEEKKKLAYRKGLAVLVLLLALTAGEYFLGAYAGMWSIIWLPLIGISLLKAMFVVRDYMHVARLWKAEGEEHA